MWMPYASWRFLWIFYGEWCIQSRHEFFQEIWNAFLRIWLFSSILSHSVIISRFYNCFLYLSKVNIHREGREGPVRFFFFSLFSLTRRIERVKSIHTLFFRLVRSLFPLSHVYVLISPYSVCLNRIEGVRQKKAPNQSVAVVVSNDHEAWQGSFQPGLIKEISLAEAGYRNSN